MNFTVELIENFVAELYENGTVDRWKREKADRGAERRPCRYDRSEIMRSAWQYRKTEGLTMSAALKRAWADARRAYLRLVV